MSIAESLQKCIDKGSNDCVISYKDYPELRHLPVKDISIMLDNLEIQFWNRDKPVGLSFRTYPEGMIIDIFHTSKGLEYFHSNNEYKGSAADSLSINTNKLILYNNCMSWIKGNKLPLRNGFIPMAPYLEPFLYYDISLKLREQGYTLYKNKHEMYMKKI